MRLALFALVLVLLHTAAAVEFEVPGATQRCFMEDISVSDGFTIAVKPLGKDVSGLEVKVTDPTGAEMHRSTDGKPFDISQVALVAGDHRICFLNTANTARRMSLTFKVGVDTHTWKDLAKAEDLDTAEAMARWMLEMTQEVHDEMIKLREREAIMRNVSESTNSRIMWLSICSILLVLVMTTWQLLQFKQFFKSKKLI
eukprot:PLAT1226.1.p2 GENE.PLAT1226.1~~PLAT1226.1.p2  ORF type:complete len:199 (-),score=90.37 PLAT1226.1:77-673(-)